MYGGNSPVYSVAKEQAKRFRIRQVAGSLEDDTRDSRPVEVITAKNIALVEELLLLSDRCRLLKV